MFHKNSFPVTNRRVIAMAKISPLHRVIDAGRWEAERLLGRLIIVVHAAFLDAGFVPHGAAKAPESGRLPKQVGRTASTLSLRYAAPQLVQYRQDAAEAAALRLCAYGRHLVFYVCIRFADPRPGMYWVCLDALAAAPLLSGGLDYTARALRSDVRVTALWSALTDGLCRRVLVDLCRENGVVLEPTLMSLPGDAKAAILARLANGEDLASVERTCTDLRRLVAHRDVELWKPRYETLRDMLLSSGGGDDLPDEAPEMSWKERYMTARRPTSWMRIMQSSYRRYRREFLALLSTPRLPVNGSTRWWPDPPDYYPFVRFGLDDRSDSPELKAETAPRPRRRREAPRGKCAAGHGQTLASSCHNKRRHGGGGAIQSPSSRFRWKHR